MTSPTYRFVSYDLNQSVEVARRLWDNKGDGAATNLELAELLDYSSANNGSFLTRLANARAFGLLSGPSSALRVSPLARRILHPEYPDEEVAARIEAFETVPLFKAFLGRYHGQTLPPTTGMVNALQTQFDIKPDKCTFVLTRLLDSAEQAGLFTVAGGRTKLIRPTLRIASAPSATDSPGVPRGDVTGGAASEAVSSAPRATPSTSPRSNKVIDGVLDMLPPKGDCTEIELTQWLGFFESALRMFYALPKEVTS